MNSKQYMAALSLCAVVSACGGSNGGGGYVPVEKVAVNGTELEYKDSRMEGPAVVFLHGAVTDLRMWDAHRTAAGESIRTLAYTQRYHGTQPWQPNSLPYGVNTHSQDLTAFLDRIKAGPVHLVAWSSAGHVAFDAALRRPELFRSVFVYEPGVPSYVTDPAALAEQRADAGAAFGPIFGVLTTTGDNVQALKLLIDASGQASGYFDTQNATDRQIQLDNARTITELLLRPEPPPAISCAQLGALKVPTRVGYGANSRATYSVVSKAAQQCIGGTHLVAAGKNHMWPSEDPVGFTRAVMDFVKEH